jgi:hypothetical protein
MNNNEQFELMTIKDINFYLSNKGEFFCTILFINQDNTKLQGTGGLLVDSVDFFRSLLKVTNTRSIDNIKNSLIYYSNSSIRHSQVFKSIDGHFYVSFEEGTYMGCNDA